MRSSIRKRIQKVSAGFKIKPAGLNHNLTTKTSSYFRARILPGLVKDVYRLNYRKYFKLGCV